MQPRSFTHTHTQPCASCNSKHTDLETHTRPIYSALSERYVGTFSLLVRERYNSQNTYPFTPVTMDLAAKVRAGCCRKQIGWWH